MVGRSRFSIQPAFSYCLSVIKSFAGTQQVQEFLLPEVSLPVFGALHEAVPQVMVLTPDTRVRTRLLQSATV